MEKEKARARCVDGALEDLSFALEGSSRMWSSDQWLTSIHCTQSQNSETNTESSSVSPQAHLHQRIPRDDNIPGSSNTFGSLSLLTVKYATSFELNQFLQVLLKWQSRAKFVVNKGGDMSSRYFCGQRHLNVYKSGDEQTAIADTVQDASNLWLRGIIRWLRDQPMSTARQAAA
jgi:hypothetical protein